MPPKKQKGKRTVAKSATKIKPRISAFNGNRLDDQGKAYARLLRDPCTAALVHPTFVGGEGGMLVRAESIFTVGVGATTTSHFFAWVPGGIGSTGTAASGAVLAEAITSGSVVTAAQAAVSVIPGYNYLAGAAADVRAVAACVQVFYPGSESTRAGLVAYGNASGAMVPSGVPTSPATVANLLERYERTPTNSIEFNWRPTDFDQTPTAPTTATPQTDLNKRGALCVSQINAPVAVGLVYRLVCVYEYTPALGSGITIASTSRSTSTSTLNSVLNALDGAGDWMVRGSALASRMVGAYNAAAFVPAVMYGGRVQPSFRLM